MADDSTVHVRTEGARTPEAAALMAADAAAGNCPFCTEREQAKAIPGLSTEHWWAKPCEPAYKGTAQHVLLITKAHFDTREPNYLPDEVMADRSIIIGLAIEMLDMPTGAILERFGNGKLNAQTVYHPHIHLFVSDGLPVTADMLPEGVEELMATIRNSPVMGRLQMMFPEAHDDPIECLDKLREVIDGWRAKELGKAWPIRPKCSNAVVSS
jgi:diadenosine tetraphosphate (Ap4A) HIT family hydrolase